MKNILLLAIGAASGFAAAVLIFRSREAGVLHVAKDPDFSDPMFFLEVSSIKYFQPGGYAKIRVVADPQG